MITVDIVTPNRKVLVGEQAESVTLPGANGEMMVLDGHTELVALLDTGAMYLQSPGGQRKFAVSHGFVTVQQDKVIVLAETCEESSEIDRERADVARKNAEAQLIEFVTGPQLEKYQRKLRRALVRQQVAESRGS